MNKVRLCVSAVLAAAIFILAGCGGGSTKDTPSASGSNANIVITAERAKAQGLTPLARAQVARSVEPLVGAGTGQVTFDAGVLQGYYRVYAWWPQSELAGSQVRVRVLHRDGETEQVVDQTQRSGQWNPIGIYAFDLNRSARIELSGLAGSRVIADAVRLQRIGDKKPPLAITTLALPVAGKDFNYETALEAESGNGVFSWHVISGELPPGIELDGANGKLRGVAGAAGEFTFSVQVTDAAGESATATYSIVVSDSETSPREDQVFQPQPAKRSDGAPSGASPDLSDLLALVAAAPEGSWIKANLNAIQDVFTPVDLRPIYGSPSAIINAWSSFAWDPNRGDLWIYGGGHANYSGNEVYRWRGSTRRWERASLPSQVKQDDLGNFMALDGYDAAPPAAHTYDNNMFLPVIDRMLVFGGAAWQNGGPFLRQTSPGATTVRAYGPFLFNPNAADGNKVGGTTGSHVQRVAPYPEVVGGNMWQNRDIFLHQSGNPQLPRQPSGLFVDGCTAYAAEGGKDVAYVALNPGQGTVLRLYRYTISNLGSPSTDTWEQVGRESPVGIPYSQPACGYDPTLKAFVRRGINSAPFVYWNLNTPSASNYETLFTPVDPSGEFPTLLSSNSINLRYCGLDFDPVRRQFPLWCSGETVWQLVPPTTLSATGWTIVKQPAPAGGVPTATAAGTGVNGKWKYIPNLDAYMGLQDMLLGNVWVYKPIGWVRPTSTTNQAPTVALTSPAAGTNFVFPATIPLTASASDSDGTVTHVQFFDGGVLLSDDASAPYTFNWPGAAIGTHTLTARAFDDRGASRTSASVNIIVAGPPQAPVVSLTAPSSGSVLFNNTTITVNASASDPDGFVTRVDFFSDGALIGTDSTAPYSIGWTSAAIGTHVLTAVAIDNQALTGGSSPVNVTVTASAGGGSTTFQDGLNGYAGTRDTYLSTYHPTLAFGAGTYLQIQSAQYQNLLRFNLFQSEGGPIPNGATITSARLSIYKSTSYDATYRLHRMLQSWDESTATWQQRASGVSWASPGANSAGVDYAAAQDAQATQGWDPGWVDFDVTGAVRQMASSGVNYGWKFVMISGNANLKRFYSSEYTGAFDLRPKLVVDWVN